MPLSIPNPPVDSSGLATAECLSGRAGRASLFNADFQIVADIPDPTILGSGLVDGDAVNPDAPDLDASAKEMEAIGIEVGEEIAGDTEPGGALQNVYRTITPTPDEKDLVGRLIHDNNFVWQKLLHNKFVEKMRTAQGSDQNVLKGFMWYMVQDFMYCLRLMFFETNRASQARSVSDFNVSADKLASYAAYTKDILKVCTTPLPTGLCIEGPVVLAAPSTPALIKYTNFQSSVAQNTNWVMALSVMIPCIQSYYQIAVRLKDQSVDKGMFSSGRCWVACTTKPLLARKFSPANSDSLWYNIWVLDNAKYGSSVERQRQFFIQHYDAWVDSYTLVSRWFRLACMGEIALWKTALNPGNLTS